MSSKCRRCLKGAKGGRPFERERGGMPLPLLAKWPKASPLLTCPPRIPQGAERGAGAEELFT